MKGTKPRAPQGRDHIDGQSIYPVGVFLKRLGIGRHSLTALRRQGLPVRSIGTRLMIDGAEALAFLRQRWRQPDTAKGETVALLENAGGQQ